MNYFNLNKICNIKTGKLDANASSENGRYPFFTCSQEPLKIDNYSYDCECVLVAGNGDLNVKYYNGKFDAYQRTYIIEVLDKSKYSTQFIYYLIQSKIDDLKKQSIGAVIKYIKLSNLINIKVPDISIEEQNNIVKKLKLYEELIRIKNTQIEDYNKLVNSKFYELFGDLDKNSYNWEIVNILDVSKFDTSMTTDFVKYAKYPHIGIENIEKITGKLINYKSVEESNLTSGKYLFDERHIIYSKIRPNLNKVATPDFKGLCSADSYPILTNERCEREYLAFILRSDYFLNYILNYSTRANIPKVNKEQISGFKFPLPPIEYQEKFVKFYSVIVNSIKNCENDICELKKLLNLKMLECFN